MNNERGKFVVFEGADGCGKGTQIVVAENLLKKNGIDVFSTREPGGPGPSEEIRKLIFQLKAEKLIGPEGQMVMFFTARKFWKDNAVKPKINNGTNVLSDRSYPSTNAYQGYGEGGDKEKILKISNIMMGDAKPDAVILLRIEPETSLRRRGKDPDGDPFDRETPEYLSRVIFGYDEMARTGWDNLQWYVINGEPKPEIVSESIAKVLEDIFEKKLQR